MRKWIITFIISIVTLLSAFKAEGQTITQTYIDPCDNKVYVVTIPFGQNQTIAVIRGKSKIVTLADISSGAFQKWVNDIFSTPCTNQSDAIAAAQAAAARAAADAAAAASEGAGDGAGASDGNNFPDLKEEDVLSYIGKRYGREINSLDELTSLLKKHEHSEIFMDLPIGRTKPPNNKYSFDDLVSILNSNKNIRYFAIYQFCRRISTHTTCIRAMVTII